MSGAGTSSTSSNTASQTQPYGPSQNNLQSALQNASQLTNNPSAGAPSNPGMWGAAQNTVNQLPNPGVAAANMGSSFSGGDPSGLLGPALAAYQKSVSPIAGMSADPMSNPETQNLLQAIQDQTTQSINGQFAGAGRSMSGYNTKDLAMGLSEGEAPTLFNQYNQNLSNIQGASSGLLGANQTTASQEGANESAGLQMTTAAPAAALLPATAAQTASNTPMTNEAQLAALGQNLTLPIAGLGGSGSGSSQGTATNSLLSQLGQVGNLLGGLFGVTG